MCVWVVCLLVLFVSFGCVFVRSVVWVVCLLVCAFVRFIFFCFFYGGVVVVLWLRVCLLIGLFVSFRCLFVFCVDRVVCSFFV